MRDMGRKWGELLGDEKDTSSEEINNDNSSRGVNNGSNNNAKLVSTILFQAIFLISILCLIAHETDGKKKCKFESFVLQLNPVKSFIIILSLILEIATLCYICWL